MKPYTVTCPDEDCAHEFTVEMDSSTLIDDAELITCPECEEPWEWEYDTATDTLELLPDLEEDDEESGDLVLESTEDDEEDDPDETGDGGDDE